MLIQVHHQFPGHYEVVGQFDTDDLPDDERNSKYNAEIRKIQLRWPLPPGAQWRVCTEKSEHFVWAAPEDGD